MPGSDLIIALDVGTTNVKAALVEPSTSTLLSTRSCPLQTTILESYPERVEIDPLALWRDIRGLLRGVAEGNEGRVAGIGISTFRGSFLTCDRETGEPLHNIITWADRRAADICNAYNASYLTQAGRWVLWLIGKLVRSDHLVCLSTFEVTTKNVHFRYTWVLEEVPRVRELLAQDRLAFATLDCWLVHQLTGRWATDYSNAAATGFYDIWSAPMKWCPMMSSIFGHPLTPFPEVLPSDGCYGETEVLGPDHPVPVRGVVADQQASHLGNDVTSLHQLKITMGTCTSCSLITGSEIHPSADSIFPQLAWRWENGEAVFMAECMTLGLEGWKIEGLVSAGLVGSLSELDGMAGSVQEEEEEEDCPWFVAGNTPLPDVREGMRGVKEHHSPAHLVRAVLEAHAFSAATLLLRIREFYSGASSRVLVDGGASRSDFILQALADVTGLEVERAPWVDGALMGAFRAAANSLRLTVGRGGGGEGRVFVCNEERRNVIRGRYDKWHGFEF